MGGHQLAVQRRLDFQLLDQYLSISNKKNFYILPLTRDAPDADFAGFSPTILKAGFWIFSLPEANYFWRKINLDTFHNSLRKHLHLPV